MATGIHDSAGCRSGVVAEQTVCSVHTPNRTGGVIGRVVTVGIRAAVGNVIKGVAGMVEVGIGDEGIICHRRRLVGQALTLVGTR